MDGLIGHSLGRYHILEQLGEGGMAIVYKAFDTRLERVVAVKIIRTDQFAPAALQRILIRFEREAKALANLSHSNIVKVLDYGEQDGIPYLVMDYLPGGTLKARLGKPIPWQETAQLLMPVAEALGYAHEHGIIHRDVKPSNILMTGIGQPMLTDFGIAKLLESEETQSLTGTGVGLGTPEYMAPEQGLGQAVDQRADLYALGVVFYEMVTGHKPYRADTPMAIMLKKTTEPLPRPSQFIPGLPEPVENFLLKSLARDPVNRYQSAGEMVTSLEGLLAGKWINGPLMEKEEKPRSGKNIYLWLAGAVGALLLIGVCVIAAVILLPRLLNRSTTLPGASIPLSSASPTGQILPASTNTFILTDTIIPTSSHTLTPTPQASWQQGQIVYVVMNNMKLNDITMQEMTANAVPRLLLASKPGQQLYAPSLSPDSSKVVYYDFLKIDGILDVNTRAILSFPYCNSPSFSPDGKQIICGDQGQFKFLDNSGGQVSSLNVGFGLLPAISPDGSEVVFATWNGNKTSIWKISSLGGNAISLASDASENYGPSWSPDGQQIAYQSGDGSGVDDIWIMDHDGGNKQQITNIPGKFSRSPVWSPDGKWLAFVSSRDASVDPDYGDVYVVSLSTREVTQVTHTGGRVLDWRVSWGH